MKKSIIRCVSAAASAVMLMSALSADCLAAENSAVFDKTDYCSITAEYTKNKGTVISWKKFDGAKKYMIYRSTNGGDFKLLASTDKLSYTDKKCQNGNTYRYKVYASDGSNKSAVSDYFYLDIGDDGSSESYYYDMPKDYGSPSQYTPDDPVLYVGHAAGDEYEYEAAGMEDITVTMPDSLAEIDSAFGYDGGSDSEENRYSYYSQEDISAGTLTAGRWNDNKSYVDFIRTLNGNEWTSLVSKWNIAPTGRYTVNVTDGTSPVENAKAEVLDSSGNVIMTAVTDNKGTAYVFPAITGKKASKLRVTSADGQTVTESFKNIKNSTFNVSFEPAAKAEKQLDLMFLVDTTGSMGDELEYLKKETEDVIDRVSEANNGLGIRVSVNFYRDEGDEYTVRSYMFRDRISTVQHSLSEQYADGGGDYPEAVHKALDVAVNEHSWNTDSTKVMFWLLDAPPHDDEEIMAAYKSRILDAAAKGIRIVPVISSGSDTETEYLTRCAAVLTGGTFLFLTDDSGVGYAHHEPEVGQHEVKKLNDLMVGIINEYLE